MATVALKIGPADHGRLLAADECASASYEPGYKYEIIDGRLYVSPEANLPEYRVEDWLLDLVKTYAWKHPKVFNFVTNKARVFVPGRRMTTVPEPDLAAYCGFPRKRPFKSVRWQDVSPSLVAEVLTEGDPDKDLVRNVALYLQVPTIREYWILDTREDPDRPQLIVHRRRAGRWQIIEVAFGETYTTPLMPGFKLLLDPHK